MQTVCLDGSLYHTPAQVHEALARMLALPAYYGGNADALNDCLSERRQPVSLWIMNRGAGDVAAAIELIARVFSDNGGTVKELIAT